MNVIQGNKGKFSHTNSSIEKEIRNDLIPQITGTTVSLLFGRSKTKFESDRCRIDTQGYAKPNYNVQIQTDKVSCAGVLINDALDDVAVNQDTLAANVRTALDNSLKDGHFWIVQP